MWCVIINGIFVNIVSFACQCIKQSSEWVKFYRNLWTPKEAGFGLETTIVFNFLQFVWLVYERKSSRFKWKIFYFPPLVLFKNVTKNSVLINSKHNLFIHRYHEFQYQIQWTPPLFNILTHVIFMDNRHLINV